jgi:hypothetical protein
MNSFTDATLRFPYQSSMVSEHVGGPESPEIHLAISTVAELLLPVCEESKAEKRLQRIVAVRVASAAVLFGWPLPAAEQDLRSQLGLALKPKPHLPASRISNEKDWLAEAADRLRGEGVAVTPGFQRQRSNYGWRPLEDPCVTVQSEA